MARYTGPKNRIARRFGVNIFGTLRNPLLHKPNPPGMHGAKRRKKSDYGLQLDEQQKLRASYGLVSRKKTVSYFKKAASSKKSTPLAFARFFECRLDTVVYRLKFAPTIFGAHQLVAHGHVLVNGKKVDIRSFQVKPGMVISIKPKSQNMAIIKKSLESSKDIPEFLMNDPEKFSGQMEILPELDQIPFALPINVPLICEFLSHTS
ncbi:MAG: 30S ribosomal protein S4 [Chlamydiae bacterium]|nr:30S ribosomal protein S4 [Chlamydiota bacterium]